MCDLVNNYFRQFYPPDYKTNWESEWCVGAPEKSYKGDRAKAHNGIFPLMKCADGFEMSVQGHFGAYSYPRGDFEESYTAVEVMLVPPHVEPLLDKADNSEPWDGKDYKIYGYVPIAVIEEVLRKHGGLITPEKSEGRS